MKNIFKASLVALTAASAAIAATTTDTFNSGDVLVGFYSDTGTGGTSKMNLMVNLGSYTNFDNKDGATTNFSSSIVSDLVATYGSSWNTRTDISWSVAGFIFPAKDGLPRNTVFATSPRANVSDAPIAIASNTDSFLSANARTPIAGIATAFNYVETTANSTLNVLVSDASGGINNNVSANSFRTKLAANAPQFGYINTNDTNGSNVSDFYAVLPTDGTAPSGTAAASGYTLGSNKLGYFTLDSNGLSFTSTAAIPEPSTAAALAGIVVLGCVVSRRRQVRVA